jgi:hypothetical protein
MSPTIWYCPPVPSQCSAIYSNCFSRRTWLRLSSWCRKGPTMLRSSSSSLKVDGTCRYIHNSHLTIIHSVSANSLSLNHHKFILLFLITGPHTDLILPKTQCADYLLHHTFIWIWLVWACWLPWSKDTPQWQVTVTGKCLCCETDTCQMAKICLSLCFSRLSLVLFNRLQSLLSFWLVFSPVMTGLATLWNRPKVVFCLAKVS